MATVSIGSQFFYDTVDSKDFHDDFGKEKVIADIKEWIEKRL